MHKNLITAITSVVLILVIGVGIYFFTQRPTIQSMDKTAITNTMSPMPTEMTGDMYTGKLPCADCTAINVELMLHTDGTYSMTNTYVGRDVSPYVDEGTWKKMTGDATDPQATIYAFTSTENGTVQYYLVSGNQLKQLDSNKELIEAPFDTSLTKQ